MQKDKNNSVFNGYMAAGAAVVGGSFSLITRKKSTIIEKALVTVIGGIVGGVYGKTFGKSEEIPQESVPSLPSYKNIPDLPQENVSGDFVKAEQSRSNNQQYVRG